MTVLARLEQRADDAARQAERLRRMVELARELGDDGLTELITLLGSEQPTNGDGNGHTAPAEQDAPRGRDAIRQIVRERPGIWTYAELEAEMQQRGWFVSRSALEAAAKRLCDDNGEGRRIGKGRYVFPANHGEVDDESDPSDGALIPFIPSST
jgi:hypothetical protein